jgi:hypothetical protein
LNGSGDIAERMRVLRERQGRGLRRLTIDVSADDLRAIAKRGYEGAVTTDHDQQAQAVGLFLNDADEQAGRFNKGLGDQICGRATRLPASTAPADSQPNKQLRRNATALPPHVTMSHTPLHRHSSVGK